MDEILIGDKKYVSSKQAAKVTGYAKDYVGQLCREGRVPARLVGRSWYVLESALQDHRFGDKKTGQETIAGTRPMGERTSPFATWEKPRYEASEGEVLPQMRHSNEEGPAEPEQANETNMVEHLQDSWRAWFDHIGAAKETVPDIEEQKEEVIQAPEAEIAEIDDAGKEVSSAHDTNIPIHVVYEPPPSELLPENAHQKQAKILQTLQLREEQSPVPQRKLVKLMTRTGIALGFILALSTATLAAVNSGYIDKYVYSFERASLITGIHLYNK